MIMCMSVIMFMTMFVLFMPNLVSMAIIFSFCLIEVAALPLRTRLNHAET